MGRHGTLPDETATVAERLPSLGQPSVKVLAAFSLSLAMARGGLPSRHGSSMSWCECNARGTRSRLPGASYHLAI